MTARCVVCEQVEEFAAALPSRCSSCGAAKALRLVREAAAAGDAPRWRRESLPVLARHAEEALARAR